MRDGEADLTGQVTAVYFYYTSFLGISEALHLDIFHQPLRSPFFDSL
jgi:hypothetical protein